MCGTMNVQVEVWPVAADDMSVWLLADDAWRSAPVPQDSDPHFEVENLLTDHHVADPPIVHSTSWRADGPHVMLTYIVVVDVGPDVLARWPDAKPISSELLAAVGSPSTNAAHEAPLPRYIDVLAHGVRHLRFLLDFDATASAMLTPVWRKHLDRLRPSLAGMYATAHKVSP